MANTFDGEIYRSPKTLSYINMGLFGSLAVSGVLYVLFCFGLIFAPAAQFDLGDGESMHIALALLGLVGLLEIPVRIATIVFFLVWEYRAFSNLSALKARNVEFSPGWAVGWWFIPLANLIKPFQAVRELWNESDPDFEEEAGFLNVAGGTPAIIGFWWAFFLVSGFLGRIADKLIDADGNISNEFPIVFLIASIFQIAAAVLALIIVKNITQRQEARFRKIGVSQQFQPPAPPTFNQFNQVS
jgi:hypothetical protein